MVRIKKSTLIEMYRGWFLCYLKLINNLILSVKRNQKQIRPVKFSSSIKRKLEGLITFA